MVDVLVRAPVQSRVGGGHWLDARAQSAAGLRDVWAYTAGWVRCPPQLGVRGGERSPGLDLRPLQSGAPAQHRGQARLCLVV